MHPNMHLCWQMSQLPLVGQIDSNCRFSSQFHKCLQMLKNMGGEWTQLMWHLRHKSFDLFWFMSAAPSIGLDYSHVMGGLSFVNIGPTVVKLKDNLTIFDPEPFVALTSFTFLFWEKNEECHPCVKICMYHILDHSKIQLLRFLQFSRQDANLGLIKEPSLSWPPFCHFQTSAKFPNQHEGSLKSSRRSSGR